jgi:hypothetical protein
MAASRALLIRLAVLLLVPRLFFAGRFYEMQLWIAWQARATRMTVMSGEWIQQLHVCLSEIVRVSGDDDEIVNERGRCNQTVLYRHRFAGFAQFSQKLCPSKARQRIPWNADDSRDALIKPGFQSTTSLPRR